MNATGSTCNDRETVNAPLSRKAANPLPATSPVGATKRYARPRSDEEAREGFIEVVSDILARWGAQKAAQP